jgi:hypothetical protein
MLTPKDNPEALAQFFPTILPDDLPFSSEESFGFNEVNNDLSLSRENSSTQILTEQPSNDDDEFSVAIKRK